MDWRRQFDQLVQPSEVKHFFVLLSERNKCPNPWYISQGHTLLLVTWLPSLWFCPCLCEPSSCTTWPSSSSPCSPRRSSPSSTSLRETKAPSTTSSAFQCYTVLTLSPSEARWRSSWVRVSRLNFNSFQMFAGDVGAIFACVAAGQAISGFATPLYNKIYIAVIERKDCQDLNFLHFF